MNIVKFQHNIAANKERIKNGEFNKRKCKKEIDSIICSGCVMDGYYVDGGGI